MAEALPARPQSPLPIAISDCLLGREVRYDGSSARAAFPHTLLDGLFEFRGICPEVGIGMGTPRHPIRLVGTLRGPRVVGVDDPALDVTDTLTQYGEAVATTLTDVAGYVFMQNSPSCGLFRVKIYPLNDAEVADAPMPRGRGAHAAAIVAALPILPVEENGRLHDPVLRENFVTRVFAYAHWQECFGNTEFVSADRLVAFHARYKYLLMAHSVPHCQRAGRLLSNLSLDPAQRASAYGSLLMHALAIPATLNGHANVLSHLQGYLNKRLDSHRRQEFAGLISRYRRGEQSLQAPLALIKHHLSQNADECLMDQIYLDPHPGYCGVSWP